MPVWLITGCSSGFGHEIAKIALDRGDKVVATARNAEKLKSLQEIGALTLSLDVTAQDSDIEEVIAQAVQSYGSIDILINNAAYILEAAVEEARYFINSQWCTQTSTNVTSDAEAKASFNTNFFGHLAVTRAVLPYMRKQKSGVIANMGSIAGWEGDIGYGLYTAAKFALAGITESLREEVKHLGIQVTIIEPGYFRTNFLSGGHRITAQKVIDDLKPVMDPLRKTFDSYDRKQPGDPVKGAKLIVDALTGSGTCTDRILPVRLALGRDAVEIMNRVLEREKKTLDEWEELSKSTDIDAQLVSFRGFIGIDMTTPPFYIFLFIPRCMWLKFDGNKATEEEPLESQDCNYYQ